MGEHQKAIADCQKALILDPNDGKAYGRMGWAIIFLYDDKCSYKYLAISDTWVVVYIDIIFTLDLFGCISVYHITI